MWGQIVNTLLGVWLMAAPTALNYHGLARTHDWIVGPVVATVACIAIGEVTRPLRWLNLVAGLWMLAAPWLLAYAAAASVNSMAIGLLIAVLSLSRGKPAHTFGGGWSALWRRAADTQSGRDA